MAQIAEALNEPVARMDLRDAAQSAIEAVQNLMTDIGLPTTLDKLGVERSSITKLSERAIQDTFLRTNPRILTRKDIEVIYENAFEEPSGRRSGARVRGRQLRV